MEKVLFVTFLTIFVIRAQGLHWESFEELVRGFAESEHRSLKTKESWQRCRVPIIGEDPVISNKGKPKKWASLELTRRQGQKWLCVFCLFPLVIIDRNVPRKPRLACR
jgi:hypothetical protein